MNVSLMGNVDCGLRSKTTSFNLRNVRPRVLVTDQGTCAVYLNLGVSHPRRILASRKKRTLSEKASRRIRCACIETTAPVKLQTVETQKQQTDVIQPPPTYVSAPGKIVAVGDLHGDLPKTIHSLELAGVVSRDEQGWPKWCGGNATVVQVGDVLDRGDCEIGILMLLRDLGHQAEEQGGAVYMINGNHESLNICGNFRYVTQGGFYESALAAGLNGELSLNWDDQLKARIDLYSPGGLVARELAKNPTVLVVNDTVFAHGGLLPIHVNYGLERINAEMAAWMRGDVTEEGRATPPYIAMGGPNSILWNRTLAQEQFPTPYDKFYACSLVQSVLKKTNAKRLVVGHTPQMSGCNCECNGQVWRVDVGMSEGVMNARPQVIIIEEDAAGCTVIDVVQSVVPRYDPLAESTYAHENNIQATTMQFESHSVHPGVHHSTVGLMRHKLVSRLKAYA